MGKYLSFIICLILFLNCAPSAFSPPEPSKPSQFEKESTYSIDLSNIDKPNKINPIWLSSDLNKVSTSDSACYILLTPEEYSKINALLTLTLSYKNIIQEQENLINSKIRKINLYNEYIYLEYEKTKKYKDLWTDSENYYRQEKYQHRIDNMISKLSFISVILGCVYIIGNN